MSEGVEKNQFQHVRHRPSQPVHFRFKSFPQLAVQCGIKFFVGSVVFAPLPFPPWKVSEIAERIFQTNGNLSWLRWFGTLRTNRLV